MDDLVAASRHFGLPGEPDLRAVREHIYQQISTQLCSSPQRPVDLKQLDRRLWLRHRVDGVNHCTALCLLHYLREATREQGWFAVPFDAGARWVRVLSLARDLAALHGDDLTSPTLRDDRVQRICDSALLLRSAGFAVDVVDVDINIDEEVRVQVAKGILARISEVGGAGFVDTLFARLSPAYDARQERYHILRNASTRGGVSADPPLGYLLNLAVRVLETPDARAGLPREVSEDVEQLACAFVASSDMQISLPLGVMNLDYPTLIRELQGLAFWDGVRTFEQLSPTRLVAILTALCDVIATSSDLGPVASLVAAVPALARAAFGSIGRSPGPCIVTQAELAARSGLPGHELEQLLERFSVRANTANSKFLLPEDFTHVDALTVPFLATSGGFWIIDRHVAAASFLVALVDLVSSAGQAGTKALGRALEHAARDAFFRQPGLRVGHGRYFFQGQEQECDCIVETASTVYVVESKYRQFHAESRASDATLLQDIRRAVLEPMIQAGYHEIALRSSKQLALTSDDGSHVVELGERPVERIAVTLREFGALQSREIVERLLTLAAGAQWTAQDARANAALGSLRKCSKKLLSQHEALLALDTRTVGQPCPHMNCWSLSLSQLLLVLDELGPGADLDSVMGKTRRVRAGSLDEYYERARMRAPSETLKKLIEFGSERDGGFIFAGATRTAR